ncbi:hypothetical protein, partial [Acidithiobacillus ferrooxidans]|uniref:hypothetical protein n=1 Tax=Acidithiobacillus ferrooxidans TaxID=920 RepID=UPI003FD6FEBA
GLQLVELVFPTGFPGSRREAITSRPLLLSAIGRSTKHAGQTHRFSDTHACRAEKGGARN